MKHLLFAISAVMLMGCISHSVTSQETTPVAVETPEIEVVESAPAPPPDPLADLRYASRQLIVVTHHLRAWGNTVRRHEETWDRSFYLWTRAVDDWLRGVTSLTANYGRDEELYQLDIFLDLERCLTDLATAERAMSRAVTRTQHNDLIDAISPHLDRTLRVLDYAESSLYELENIDPQP